MVKLNNYILPLRVWHTKSLTLYPPLSLSHSQRQVSLKVKWQQLTVKDFRGVFLAGVTDCQLTAGHWLLMAVRAELLQLSPLVTTEQRVRSWIPGVNWRHKMTAWGAQSTENWTSEKKQRNILPRDCCIQEGPLIKTGKKNDQTCRGTVI